MRKNRINLSGNKMSYLVAFLCLLPMLIIDVQLFRVSTLFFNSSAIVFIIMFGAVLIIYNSYFLRAVFYFNRDCCRVYFDKNSEKLCRRGLFFGFKSEVSLLDVKKVVSITIKDRSPKDDDPYNSKYIVFIDEENNTFNEFKNKAYIRIADNEKNRDLLREFCNREVVENYFTMTYHEFRENLKK